MRNVRLLSPRVISNSSYSFLDLMKSASSSLLVPTLDIDLVWHTHQLMPTSYKEDCERYVERFIDQ
jgi:hypothetical protein